MKWIIQILIIMLVFDSSLISTGSMIDRKRLAIDSNIKMTFNLSDELEVQKQLERKKCEEIEIREEQLNFLKRNAKF